MFQILLLVPDIRVCRDFQYGNINEKNKRSIQKALTVTGSIGAEKLPGKRCDEVVEEEEHVFWIFGIALK